MKVKSNKPSCLFLLIVTVLFAQSVDAGTNKWSTRGPYLEQFRSFAFHKEKPGLVIAAGRDGIHRSVNSGRTWERVQICCVNNARGDLPVRAHPANPNVFLAAASNLWISNDGGVNWEILSENAGCCPAR